MSKYGNELREGAIVWRDAAIRARFAALGMTALDDFLRAEGLLVVKDAVRWKRICRSVDPEASAAEFPAFYLKIFEGVPARERRRQRWSRGRSRSAAAREWEALRHLEEAEIRAPRALVMGEEKSGLFKEVRRAFVVTAALPPGPSLEELVMQAEENGEGRSARRALARRLGILLGRIHASGLNHRDFYAGHIRVDEAGEPWVLDLDRAQIRAEVPRRWRVKDLAALDFSVPERLVGDDLRALFLASYRRYATGFRRRKGAGEQARRLVAEIKVKSASMRRRARKKIARGDSNIHINE